MRDVSRHNPVRWTPVLSTGSSKKPRALHYTTAYANRISTQNGCRTYLRFICRWNSARYNAVSYWASATARSVALHLENPIKSNYQALSQVMMSLWSLLHEIHGINSTEVVYEAVQSSTIHNRPQLTLRCERLEVR